MFFGTLFFQKTIPYGNSKNDIRHGNGGRRREEISEYGKYHSGQEKRCPNDLTVAQANSPQGVATHQNSEWITQPAKIQLLDSNIAKGATSRRSGRINQQYWHNTEQLPK